MDDLKFTRPKLPIDFVNFFTLRNTQKFLLEIKRMVKRLELSYEPNDNESNAILNSVIHIVKNGLEDLLDMCNDVYFSNYIWDEYQIDLESIEYDLSLLLARLIKLQNRLYF